MTTPGRLLRFVLPAALLAISAVPAAGAQQTILGRRFLLKDGTPSMQKVIALGVELNSPNTIFGDPVAYGATLDVLTNGVTSTSQTFTLPAAYWRAVSGGFLYRDSGANGPVKVALIKLSGTTFKLKVLGLGRLGTITVVPPNTGNYAGMMLNITGGDTYCVNFGGAALGQFRGNDANIFRIVRPTLESVCPSLTPSCGDNVIQPPFEDCDGTSDTACVGQCRPPADTYECLCPFCGDQIIQASNGEICDNSSLGPCTEGCPGNASQNPCTACAMCGDARIDPPVEDCEVDADCAFFPYGSCRTGAGNCDCRFCGDGILDAGFGEACDAPDDAACPGSCLEDCTCETTTTTVTTSTTSTSL
jgi:hypothetical protein